MTLGHSHHSDSPFRLFVPFPLLLFFLISFLKQGRAYTPPLARTERRTLASACLDVESLVQCQALHAMPVNVRNKPLLLLLSKEAHACHSRSTLFPFLSNLSLMLLHFTLALSLRLCVGLQDGSTSTHPLASYSPFLLFSHYSAFAVFELITHPISRWGHA